MVLIKTAGKRSSSRIRGHANEVSASLDSTITGGTTRTPADIRGGAFKHADARLGMVIPVIGIMQGEGEPNHSTIHRAFCRGRKSIVCSKLQRYPVLNHLRQSTLSTQRSKILP